MLYDYDGRAVIWVFYFGWREEAAAITGLFHSTPNSRVKKRYSKENRWLEVITETEHALL